MKTTPGRRFVTLAILVLLGCNAAFSTALESDVGKNPDSKSNLPAESPERIMSRHFKFLAEANNDVFFHPALKSLITVLRTNILDPGSRVDELTRTAANSSPNKRSPLAVGFVPGLGDDHHQHRSHAVFLVPTETSHHEISAAAAVVAKTTTAAGHVEGGVHGPNHLGLDAANTLLVHHPQPIIIHEVPASAVHVTLHDEAKTAVTVTHHQPVIVNTEPAVVVVRHDVELTHPAATEVPSDESYREHFGGYGVGVDSGGAGAGHGFYAG